MLLEEDVVVFTAADLEDQLTDIEQVVPADTELWRKMQKTNKTKQNKTLADFCFEVPKRPCVPL